MAPWKYSTHARLTHIRDSGPEGSKTLLEYGKVCIMTRTQTIVERGSLAKI